jgi:hypothetical protein
MLAGQTTASADFSGDFAPANWTYAETNTSGSGPSGTLSSSQMQLTSADWNPGSATPNTSGSYSITIPYDVGLITFNYSYVTRDRDGSSYDMPTYTVGGVASEMVASDIPDNGTESGTKWIDVNNLSGTILTIAQPCTDCIYDSATITITGFTAIKKPSSNTLRVDSSGVATEKNNIVTCTPGKYTFFNGGSTPETAKVQSYVYTLILNGKPVSTISTDNFKTVAAHMFPSIAGNLSGSATLEGASWDVKGVSDYTAQCQIYAYPSGANIQSVTSMGYDAVALAVAAEAAAKAQMAKDMIANWNASNEALIKKYRDQRLATKP